MKEALVVFAKAPLPGQVKTRLLGILTPEQAAEVALCFLRDTFALMEAVQAEREALSLVLCYAPADAIEAFEAADLDGCLLLAQEGADLGARLRNCFADLFAAGFEAIVILGADSPTLPAEIVMEAFDCLAAPSQAVVGPATDGGYYLIGLNQPQPQLFADIDWGSELVCAQTQSQAQKTHLALTLLPEWYDVDTPAELAQLQHEIAAGQAAPRWTSKFLQRLAKSRDSGLTV
jgi:rSAM/selenodomain-associated transferase 1